MKRYVLALILVAFIVLAGCTTTEEPTPVPQQPTEAPIVEPTATDIVETEPTATPEPQEDETEAYPEPEDSAYPAPEDDQQMVEPEIPAGYPAPEEDQDSIAWTPDGIVGEDEYTQQTQIGDVTVYWAHDGEYLYLAAEAETSGWLSVGLDPENRMQGANYLIAAFEDGQGMMWDAYGQAPVGATHPPDTEIGGTDDIVAFVVTEMDDVTLFEVQIPLDSGDEYDKPLQPGETFPMIVAVGASDDYNAPHVFRGAGELSLR